MTNSRRIGKDAERELCRLLDGQWRRISDGLVLCCKRSAIAGKRAEDAAHNMSGVHWEITRAGDIAAKWEQAIDESMPGEVPVLWLRRPRRPWRVMLAIHRRWSSVRAVAAQMSTAAQLRCVQGHALIETDIPGAMVLLGWEQSPPSPKLRAPGIALMLRQLP